MSFRFTNDLITTFKQKALMKHYGSTFLFPRHFVGYCAGVTAKINSSCEVLELTVDEKGKAGFMEAATNTGSSSPAVPASGAGEGSAADSIASKALGGSEAATSTTTKHATVDCKKLAKAIEMAIWDATRKVKAAKEEYYHLSVKNARLQVASKETTGEAPESTEAELATIRDFSMYGLTTDAALIGPHPWNSFRDRSPFNMMLNMPNYNLGTTSSSGNQPAHAAKEFAPSRPMTLSEILPEYRAAFLSYPAGAWNSTIKDTSAGKGATSGASSEAPITPEQRKASAAAAATADAFLARKEVRQLRSLAAAEEANDELAFWTRVEAIRKGQQAVIGATLNKRPYKDQAGAVPVSNWDQKVSLQFIH